VVENDEVTVLAGEAASLVCKLPEGEVEYPLLSGDNTIGRDPSNTVCLPDDYVSKFHARLVRSGNGFTLVDLDSANKTLVNGRVVRESAVRYGDEIHIAGVRCRLLAPHKARSAPVRRAADPRPIRPATRAATPRGDVTTAHLPRQRVSHILWRVRWRQYGRAVVVIIAAVAGFLVARSC
jgi:hypothetical protein